MTTEPRDDGLIPALPAADSWAAADTAADLHRWARLHPSCRRVLADRVLPPVLAALFIVEIAGVSGATLLPRGPGDTVRLWVLFLVVVSIALGFGWNWWSERFTFRGATSILTALPLDARASARRQITGRAPLDREHCDTLVELAEQTRRRQHGLVGIYGCYLPFLVGMASERTGGWVLLVLVGALIVAAFANGVAEDRRLARFLRSAEGTPRVPD